MFEFLSEIGRKLYGFIYDAVKNEIPFNEFYETIKDNFPEYNQYEAYLDYMRTKQQKQWWEEMDKIPLHEAWGRDYFAPATKPTPKRFMISFEVEGFNINTKEYEKRYITVGMDELHIRQFWEEEVRNAFQFGEEIRGSDKFVIMDIKPIKAWRGW